MITELGFQRPTFDDILADNLLKFKNKFTETIDSITYVPALEPTDELGAEAEILANIKDELYQLLEQVYYNAFLVTATGVQLDRLAIPTTRKTATAATAATFVLSGSAGTSITAGTLFETEDKRQYSLRSTVIIGSSGDVVGIVDAVVPGIAGNAPIGSITFIPVFLSGLDSVTNSVEATGGTDIEDDASLRARAIAARFAGQSSSLESIIGQIKQISGVTQVTGVENLLPEFIGALSPGAIELTIRGGADQAIADKILAYRPAGNPSYGSTQVVVTDINGYEHLESFSRAVDVQIYVAVTLHVNSFYSTVVSNDVIRQRILEYIGGVNPSSVTYPGLNAGDDVFAWKAKATLWNNSNPNMIPGLIDATVLIGKSTGDRTHEEIEILDTEEAITDFANISITISFS
jgi:uncharacterized phage protein gp47/JayE